MYIYVSDHEYMSYMYMYMYVYTYVHIYIYIYIYVSFLLRESVLTTVIAALVRAALDDSIAANSVNSGDLGLNSRSII